MNAFVNWLFGLLAVGIVVFLMIRSIVRRKPADDYPSENGDGSYP